MVFIIHKELKKKDFRFLEQSKAVFKRALPGLGTWKFKRLVDSSKYECQTFSRHPPMRHQRQKGAKPKQKSQIVKRLRVQPKFCFQYCKPEVREWWRCLSAGLRLNSNSQEKHTKTRRTNKLTSQWIKGELHMFKLWWRWRSHCHCNCGKCHQACKVKLKTSFKESLRLTGFQTLFDSTSARL